MLRVNARRAGYLSSKGAADASSPRRREARVKSYKNSGAQKFQAHARSDDTSVVLVEVERKTVSSGLEARGEEGGKGERAPSRMETFVRNCRDTILCDDFAPPTEIRGAVTRAPERCSRRIDLLLALNL